MARWTETLAVAGDAARRDPRVRFQRNERNLGMSANFNALARAARGEFLVAIGDDDRLLPEFVSRLVGVMRPELGVAFSNHYLINAEGTRLEPESREYTRHYGRDTIPAGVLENADAAAWRPIDPDVGFTFAHRRSPAASLSGRLEYARRRIFHPSRAPRRALHFCPGISDGIPGSFGRGDCQRIVDRGTGRMFDSDRGEARNRALQAKALDPDGSECSESLSATRQHGTRARVPPGISIIRVAVVCGGMGADTDLCHPGRRRRPATKKAARCAMLLADFCKVSARICLRRWDLRSIERFVASA